VGGDFFHIEDRQPVSDEDAFHTVEGEVGVVAEDVLGADELL
jgi:hypothetical protein